VGSFVLALPPGELSPQVTERVLALPLGELSPWVVLALPPGELSPWVVLALPPGELSPQVTERAPLLNGPVNLFAHTAKIPVNIPVGEPQNLQSKSS